ncbi:MAG: hypothetical protein AAFQ07_14480, partial [Chloroflexota bacterium]
VNNTLGSVSTLTDILASEGYAFDYISGLHNPSDSVFSTLTELDTSANILLNQRSSLDEVMEGDESERLVSLREGTRDSLESDTSSLDDDNEKNLFTEEQSIDEDAEKQDSEE